MRGRTLFCRVAAAAAAATVVVAVGVAKPAPAAPLDATISATNGTGRSVTPGRPCSDGGNGAYWHYEYAAPLAPRIFSALPGDWRVHLAINSDVVRFPGTGGAYPSAPPGPTAFLLGEESHLSVLNERGSLKLRLRSGDCAQPTLTFDGRAAAGRGTWRVDRGTGAYRGATGTGSFRLDVAEVAPGADNALQLELLESTVAVQQPSAKVEVLGTYWGQLGLDYLTRRPTVVYRITNTGPGDSYGSRLVAAQPASAGVTLAGRGSGALGDLGSGDSVIVHVRWQLGALQPCGLVITGCRFDTTLTVDLPDALDVAHVVTSPKVSATAPILPPPV